MHDFFIWSSRGSIQQLWLWRLSPCIWRGWLKMDKEYRGGRGVLWLYGGYLCEISIGQNASEKDHQVIRNWAVSSAGSTPWGCLKKLRGEGRGPQISYSGFFTKGRGLWVVCQQTPVLRPSTWAPAWMVTADLQGMAERSESYTFVLSFLVIVQHNGGFLRSWWFPC